MTRVWDVPVHDSTRVRDVRVAAEVAAGHAGLDQGRTDTVSLVATELATNLLKHGGGGQVLIETVQAEPASAVQILAIDHGPGIVDVQAALRDGHSTTGSLGAGLGTCRRLSDDFDLHTVPGRGTVVLARVGSQPLARAGVRAHAAPVPAAHVGGLHVPLGGEQYSGDAWSCAGTADNVLTVMIADGLGHGPEAARASDAAVAQLKQNPGLSPVTLLGLMDRALRHTRGAAVAIAQLDTSCGRLEFAGTGNIGARLRTDGTWQHLLSRPGIVGAYRHPTLVPRRLPWAGDGLLVLHSDGLPSRWQSPLDPDLDRHHPAVVAGVILRDASSPARPVRDDTTVAVLTASP